MTTARHVPCGGCTACCKRDAVRILSHEDASRWQTEPRPYVSGAHKPNGDCVYLGQVRKGVSGCTIHGATPQMCGELDCRELYQRISFDQLRRVNVSLEVWRQGQRLSRGKR
jgi:hypothetical protein